MSKINPAEWDEYPVHEIEALLDERDALRAELAEVKRERDDAMEALEFYADPENYHAISFMADRPCGAFADDLSDSGHPDYNRPMPGKHAREALKTTKAP